MKADLKGAGGIKTYQMILTENYILIFKLEL